MPTSIRSGEVCSALEKARVPSTTRVQVNDRVIKISAPFPSPADWRDHWMYSLIIDRFNNPQMPPRSPSWDEAQHDFQGGTLNGVRAQLPYLKELGVGAILLSPVLKNCQYDPRSYHGYGPQNFMMIEPRFTSDPARARLDRCFAEQELRNLIDESHARGIYVILDIVLNHAGNVFEYANCRSVLPWRDYPYPIRWRDGLGRARPAWSQAPVNEHMNAAIYPVELCRNSCFVRKGEAHKVGDFYTYRKLATNVSSVRDSLIQIHKYLIARYDVDGFRIDALDLLDEEFALIFPDAIRNYALSIGKRNFLIFGEIAGNDNKITRFVGRNSLESGDLMGVDAMLDYPLFYVLPDVIKGFAPSIGLVRLFEQRKELHRGIIGFRGEPSKHFITFLENHDQHRRFYHSPPSNPHGFDDQVTMGLGCLFCLQGMPCLYYGCEQGLRGTKECYSHGSRKDPKYEWVRESLWGKPEAFGRRHPFFQVVQRLTAIRLDRPALRYGEMYFRPVSGNGFEFGYSTYPQGVIAFSRILSDDEVVCVANTNIHRTWCGQVIVDFARNAVDSTFKLLFSNKREPANPRPVVYKIYDKVAIQDREGATSSGPIKIITVHLKPMEIQILGKAS